MHGGSRAAFEYDDAGRQTKRTITDEVTGKVTTEVLTWDVASNLVSSVVDDGSHYDYWTYLYDASGQRWAKIEHPTDVTLPTQATVYLGDTEITDTDTFVNDATPDVTATRFFTFGGSTVATEIATEGAATVPFFFLFGDYQGSAQLMLPDLRDGSGDYDLHESAAHIQRNAYTPYGSQRALNTDLSDDSPDVTFDASLSIERGWLSQVADEATSSLGTGLTYLNARYYDPLTSRFLSPDPMLDVMDPKTLDPYRYAENNPVFYADVTGLSPESVCGLYGCPKASSSVCGLYGCFGGKPGGSTAARDAQQWHESTRRARLQEFLLLPDLKNGGILAPKDTSYAILDTLHVNDNSGKHHALWPDFPKYDIPGIWLGPDTDYVKELRRHWFFSDKALRNYVTDQADSNGGLHEGQRLDKHNFDVSGLGGLDDAMYDFMARATNGLVGNLSTAHMGSSDVDLLVYGVNSNSYTVVVRVYNESHAESTSRIPGTPWHVYSDRESGFLHNQKEYAFWLLTVPRGG